MRRSVSTQRGLLSGSVLLLCAALSGCGADDAGSPGATPEQGLRKALDFDGSTVRLRVTLDGGDAADVHAPALVDHERFRDRFPVVVLLQGGLVPKEQYGQYASRMAGYGFVVIVPEHLRAVPPQFPDPVALTEARVIPAALAAVEALDRDPASAIYLSADTARAALTGHSHGGLVSLLALGGRCLPSLCTAPFVLPPAVRAAALFGTHSVSNGKATPIDPAGAAVALLQGALDGRSAPDKAALTYETLTAPRALLTFAGLNHFAITDSSQIAGAIPDPNPQAVEQQEGGRRLALWAALWLHASLAPDSPATRVARHWLTAPGASDAEVSIRAELPSADPK